MEKLTKNEEANLKKLWQTICQNGQGTPNGAAVILAMLRQKPHYLMMKEGGDLLKACRIKIKGSQWENHFDDIDQIDNKKLDKKIKERIGG